MVPKEALIYGQNNELPGAHVRVHLTGLRLGIIPELNSNGIKPIPASTIHLRYSKAETYENKLNSQTSSKHMIRMQ